MQRQRTTLLALLFVAALTPFTGCKKEIDSVTPNAPNLSLEAHFQLLSVAS